MEKNNNRYYKSSTMKLKKVWISELLDKFVKNYSREEVAAEFNLFGNSCLDIACGDGDLLNNYLFKKYNKLDGVDISKLLISKARKKGKQNCNFYVEDIEKYVDNAISKKKQYDSIYMLAILEHIMWPLEFLKSVYKILRKSGRVVVEVPNTIWLPHRIDLMLGKFPTTASTVGVIPGVRDEHIRFFTHNTLDKIFQKAGFKKIKNDSAGKLRGIKNLLPELLSPDIISVYEK